MHTKSRCYPCLAIFAMLTAVLIAGVSAQEWSRIPLAYGDTEIALPPSLKLIKHTRFEWDQYEIRDGRRLLLQITFSQHTPFVSNLRVWHAYCLNGLRASSASDASHTEIIVIFPKGALDSYALLDFARKASSLPERIARTFRPTHLRRTQCLR